MTHGSLFSGIGGIDLGFEMAGIETAWTCDVDDWCNKLLKERFPNAKNFKNIYDVNKSDGTTERLWGYPDTIINTSTEHIDEFGNWYNNILDKQLIVLQGNNYFEIEEHVNCSNTLEEFSEKAPMSKVLYEGELDLRFYKRFMKIGYK